ncbi:MAG: 16S rRNA (guanine(966)-N(2))-methyltransferase RsmD [Erysipelotrichaceae bacterium]|nr:16S rRNA (guanine(966)-N(2))-methyltransferase RsmD [Erysipelotrichaceae bacterium]
MLRVIAGKYKGRKLIAPAGEHTKPTKDMVKEALFSSLGSLYGKRMLDLFCGSGSIGIEALSRGADAVSFVDNSSEAIGAVRDNLSVLGEKQSVHNMDVFDYLKSDDTQFDVVFLDPPYHFERARKLFTTLRESGKLNKNALIVYESGSDEKINDQAVGFKLIKEKKYGITKLFYFEEDTDE